MVKVAHAPSNASELPVGYTLDEFYEHEWDIVDAHTRFALVSQNIYPDRLVHATTIEKLMEIPSIGKARARKLLDLINKQRGKYGI